jgi:hypothetical protein
MKSAGAVDLKKRTLTKSAALLIASASLGRLGTALATSESSRGRLQEMPDRPWADPASLVSSIAAGTVAVPHVADTVGAYREGFGYVEHWRGRVPAEMAGFWGVPAMADRVVAVVGPSELSNGLIRLVELGEEFQHIPPHTTLGWGVLEIRVRAVDDVAEQLAGLPFVHTGGPNDLKFGSGPATLRAAQFQGPSGEPLYFTEDLQIDRSTLIGRNNVGGIFLQTLVAAPYLQTRDFYLKTLAMQLRAQVEFPRANVADASGVEKNRLYKMASLRAPQYCAIQIDEYPVETMKRPSAPGSFPPGVCMCTLMARDLDLVASALRGVNLPFTQTESNSIPPWVGGRALVCRGYSGEIVEFVEHRAG